MHRSPALPVRGRREPKAHRHLFVRGRRRSAALEFRLPTSCWTSAQHQWCMSPIRPKSDTRKLCLQAGGRSETLGCRPVSWRRLYLWLSGSARHSCYTPLADSGRRSCKYLLLLQTGPQLEPPRCSTLLASLSSLSSVESLYTPGHSCISNPLQS